MINPEEATPDDGDDQFQRAATTVKSQNETAPAVKENAANDDADDDYFK